MATFDSRLGIEGRPVGEASPHLRGLPVESAGGASLP